MMAHQYRKLGLQLLHTLTQCFHLQCGWSFFLALHLQKRTPAGLFRFPHFLFTVSLHILPLKCLSSGYADDAELLASGLSPPSCVAAFNMAAPFCSAGSQTMPYGFDPQNSELVLFFSKQRSSFSDNPSPVLPVHGCSQDLYVAPLPSSPRVSLSGRLTEFSGKHSK